MSKTQNRDSKVYLKFMKLMITKQLSTLRFFALLSKHFVNSAFQVRVFFKTKNDYFLERRQNPAI